MNQTNIPISKSEMSLDTKLASLAPLVSNRASEHNVFTTYVCLVKDGLSRHLHQGNSGQATDVEQATSTEEDFDGNANAAPIQVERSKAVHELIEAVKNTDHNIIQGKPPDIILEDSEVSDQDENNSYDNPKKLKLTKMKWLSEDQNGYLDSSSPSVSSIKSTTSSKESDNEVKEEPDIGEKCLSTILRLDKEHNLFGLSSITIVGSKQLKPKQKGKDDEKPVFHQTAIVQVCKSTCSKCCQPGCKNRSKSDLPCSLKYSSCGSCVSCCSRTCTSVPCTQPCYPCPKPYKPCRKPSYLRRKPSKTCPKPCYPYPKPCYPYPKSCDPYPKSCYPYPKSCYPYPKPCYPTKSCHPYPKSCYPYPKPCYPTKSCYPYPKSCYLYSKSCYPCPRPCSPPLKRPCLSSCVTCLVAPPSCALIPRTPKIHAACLPDTPMFPLETFKNIHCKQCNKGQKPQICKEESSKQGTPSDTKNLTPCRSSESLPLCRVKSPTCTCGLTAFVPPEPPRCCFGLRIKLNRKPDHRPAPHEVTPRCTSELQKPLMARSCTHDPCCRPPSSSFPYLMPCYWPCRPSAPCLDPTKCFHNPPCMRPRRPQGFVPISQECPKPGPCKNHPQGCKNDSCLGKNTKFRTGLGIWGNLCKQDLASPPKSIIKPEEKLAPHTPKHAHSEPQPHSDSAQQPVIPHNPNIKPEPKH